MSLLMPKVPMISPRNARGQYPSGGAVGEGFEFLLGQEGGTAADDFLIVGEGLKGVLFGKEIEVALIHHVGRILDPELLCHRDAAADIAGFAILEEDPIRRMAHDHLHQRLFVVDAVLESVLDGAEMACFSIPFGPIAQHLFGAVAGDQ